MLPRWEFRHSYGFHGYRKGGAQGDGEGGGGDLGAGGDRSGNGGDNGGGNGSFGSGVFGGGFAGQGTSGYGGSGFSGYSGGFNAGQNVGANAGDNAFGGSGYGIGQAGDYSNGFSGQTQGKPSFGSSFLSLGTLANTLMGFLMGGPPGALGALANSAIKAGLAATGIPGASGLLGAAEGVMGKNPLGAIQGIASAVGQGAFGSPTGPGGGFTGGQNNGKDFGNYTGAISAGGKNDRPTAYVSPEYVNIAKDFGVSAFSDPAKIVQFQQMLARLGNPSPQVLTQMVNQAKQSMQSVTQQQGQALGALQSNGAGNVNTPPVTNNPTIGNNGQGQGQGQGNVNAQGQGIGQQVQQMLSRLGNLSSSGYFRPDVQNVGNAPFVGQQSPTGPTQASRTAPILNQPAPMADIITNQKLNPNLQQG